MEETRAGARDVPVDRRASQLELQLEQVQLALAQLRQTQGSLHEMETRLGDMTRECAVILDRWARNDEKHAAAVVELHGRLSEWNDVERRLLNESATRVHQFERSLHHEWNALKAKHEAPLQELEAQSTRIAETCLTAIQQALEGFDKADARITALEATVQREMARLSADVREALAELRDQQAIGARQPWSLDNVVRLHNELRGDGPEAPAALATATGTMGGPVALRPARALEPAVLAPPPAVTPPPAAPVAEHGVEDEVESRPGHLRLGPLVAIALIVVAAVAYGLYLHNRLSNGLDAAAARAAAAERDAAASRVLAQQEIEHVRQAADARLESAAQAVTTAQLLAGIVAAPDAKRFALTGAEGAPTVQVLWSRSRGLAASASALPALPEGRAYQLWLVTRTQPASVGMLTPSPSQPVSAVFPWPADLRRAVFGAMITVEPASGSPRPTGPAWLATPPSSNVTPAPASGS